MQTKAELDSPHREGCRGPTLDRAWVLSAGEPIVVEGRRWAVLICNDALCGAHARVDVDELELAVAAELQKQGIPAEPARRARKRAPATA